MNPFIITISILALAAPPMLLPSEQIPAHDETVTTLPTGHYLVQGDDETCIYEESNGMPGFQDDPNNGDTLIVCTPIGEAPVTPWYPFWPLTNVCETDTTGLCDPSCNQNQVSHAPDVTWTHTDANSGPTGVDQPSVEAIDPGAYHLIPAGADGRSPQLIWKVEDTRQGQTPVTPIVFTHPAFPGCTKAPSVAKLTMSCDNACTAYWNGVPVATCGVLDPVNNPHSNCFHRNNHQVAYLPVLPSANTLQFEVYNHGLWGMVQYRLDY